MKARFAKLLVAAALLVAVTGTGIAAEVAGLDVVSPAAACGYGNGSGGGC